MYARFEENEDLYHQSDAELVNRFKQGHDDALDILLRRYSDALCRFCFHLTGNKEDAEDISQETLAKAIDRVDTLQAGGAFRSWLFRIAKNLSVDSFRSGRRLCSLPDDEATPVPLRIDGPLERIEASEEHHTVQAAMAGLTESHQKVLVLREVEGLSYADIATKLNVSHSAVETLLFRARRRLREEYAKRDPILARLGILGGLQGVLSRLPAPLVEGVPVAAKVGVTAALVGGAALAVPRLLPLGHHTAASHTRPIMMARQHSGKHHAAAPRAESAVDSALPGHHLSAIPSIQTLSAESAISARNSSVTHHTAVRRSQPAGAAHGTRHPGMGSVIGRPHSLRTTSSATSVTYQTAPVVSSGAAHPGDQVSSALVKRSVPAHGQRGRAREHSQSTTPPGQTHATHPGTVAAALGTASRQPSHHGAGQKGAAGNTGGGRAKGHQKVGDSGVPANSSGTAASPVQPGMYAPPPADTPGGSPGHAIGNAESVPGSNRNGHGNDSGQATSQGTANSAALHSGAAGHGRKP
jgi:RNA polymerase sigma-70 factor, ECF subfamily